MVDWDCNQSPCIRCQPQSTCYSTGWFHLLSSKPDTHPCIFQSHHRTYPPSPWCKSSYPHCRRSLCCKIESVVHFSKSYSPIIADHYFIHLPPMSKLQKPLLQPSPAAISKRLILNNFKTGYDSSSSFLFNLLELLYHPDTNPGFEYTSYAKTR